MRNLCMALWTGLSLLLLFIMLWVINGVLSQPVYGAEKGKLPLESGYINMEHLKRPQIAPKRITISTGYIVSPNTGNLEMIDTRTYQQGNQLITTGYVGFSPIYVNTTVDISVDISIDE